MRDKKHLATERVAKCLRSGERLHRYINFLGNESLSEILPNGEERKKKKVS